MLISIPDLMPDLLHVYIMVQVEYAIDWKANPRRTVWRFPVSTTVPPGYKCMRWAQALFPQMLRH